MRYITGMHALNLHCSLDTCGDWHTSSMDWGNIRFGETEGSVFGDYGVEECGLVPENEGTYLIANTLRALLDLLAEGRHDLAVGARKDFICNPKYDEEFMCKAAYLMQSDKSVCDKVDSFMENEFQLEWLRFKEKHEIR